MSLAIKSPPIQNLHCSRLTSGSDLNLSQTLRAGAMPAMDNETPSRYESRTISFGGGFHVGVVMFEFCKFTARSSPNCSFLRLVFVFGCVCFDIFGIILHLFWLVRYILVDTIYFGRFLS